MNSIYKVLSSSQFYLQLALEEIQAHSQRIFLQSGKIYALLGLTLKSTHDYDSSNEMYTKAVGIYEKSKNYTILAGLYFQICQNYFFLGKRKNANEFLSKAISIRESLNISNNNFILTTLYLYRAKISIAQGEREEAIISCEKAIEIAEEKNLQQIFAKGLLLMARIHLNFDPAEKSTLKTIENYLEEAEQITQEASLVEEKLFISLFRVYIAEKAESYTNALTLIQELSKNENLPLYPTLYIEVNEKMGLLHHHLGDFEKTREIFELAFKKSKIVNDNEVLASLHYNTACNMHNLHLPGETILHLHQAFEFAPYYRYIAKQDPDLANLNFD